MKTRQIAVIDLKAFYAFVECVDRGLDPWSTPLVVADISRSPNTIVLSVTPYLKSKGIPSRCRVKELPKKYTYIYATPRMARYIDKSSEVISIMLDFVSEEDIHVYSIDEAFIDLTSYLNYYKKSAEEITRDIIDKINKETGLTATAGIGDNFLLAKVALDIYAKKAKNGIAKISMSEIKEKLWPITPLSKMWGIGANLEKRLNKLGITTVGQLAVADPILIHEKFGIIGDQLISHANGVDDADIHEEYVPKEKSLTVGQVLPRDYTIKESELIIKEMCDDLCFRLRENEKYAAVAGLFVGYSSNLGGFSRQCKLLRPTDDTTVILEAFLQIFSQYERDLPVRRISLVLGQLSNKTNYTQVDLFEDYDTMKNRRNLQRMVDVIQRKYGKNMITRVSALLDSSTAKERHNQIGGHRK